MSNPICQLLQVNDEEVWRWLAGPPRLKPRRDPAELSLTRELGSELMSWMLSSRIPLVTSADPDLHPFIQASRSLSPVRFRYLGGSRPGTCRHIHPTIIFEVAGFPGIYLSGWCRSAQAVRTFRFDRIRNDPLP